MSSILRHTIKSFIDPHLIVVAKFVLIDNLETDIKERCHFHYLSKVNVLLGDRIRECFNILCLTRQTSLSRNKRLPTK